MQNALNYERKKRILIVEDDTIQLNALCGIINSSFNYLDVDSSSSYDDAVYLIHQNNYDLFILDIKLDDSDNKKNGFHLCESIYSKEKYIDTKIIFVTSLTDRIYDGINSYHCFGFIFKPYNDDQIITIVSSALSLAKKHDSKISIPIAANLDYSIDSDDIIYLHSNGRHHISIQMQNDIISTTAFSLSRLTELINDVSNYRFIQCHRSYSVSISKRKYINWSKGIIIMPYTDIPIPIGKNYRNIVRETANGIV